MHPFAIKTQSARLLAEGSKDTENTHMYDFWGMMQDEQALTSVVYRSKSAALMSI
jgi:hypothetical protein